MPISLNFSDKQLQSKFKHAVDFGIIAHFKEVNMDSGMIKKIEESMLITKYKRLLESFLDQQISVAEFETAYLKAVKTDPADISNELYQILQELFWAVDSYSPECQIWSVTLTSANQILSKIEAETAFTISEQKLRQVTQQTLSKLNDICFNQ